MLGCGLSILVWLGISPFPYIADLLGVTHPALNLLLTICLGYPVGIFYLKYVRKYKTMRDIYFIVTGIDLAFFNFGYSIYHNLLPGLVLYLTIRIFGSGKITAVSTFIFNMVYLLYGYWYTESDDYDITWTMPQCVLTLKMISLSFDLWDGVSMKKGVELSENSKKTALEEPPTLIQIMGFICFPACFLIGPIFSFKRYKEFVDDMYPIDVERGTYENQGFLKLLQGLLYLIAFQVGNSVFNMKYMLSDEFNETSILYRHFYCGMWAHFALYKYIACWLITEAACIRIGFSYNGVVQEKEKSITKWDGCNNIKLLRFESATKFQHYIDSFNCNTNHFAAEYIYKRLKFLGNKNLSQLFTLFFLAAWHGVKSGYYVTFFNEFMIMHAEKEFESMLVRTSLYKAMWSNTYTKYALYTLLKVYTIVFMGWSLVPFDLKAFPKWFKVYSSVYFSGFIFFLPWSFLYKPVAKKLFSYLDRPQ